LIGVRILGLKVQHFLENASSENLAKDYYEMEKNNTKIMALIGIIILPFSIIILPIALGLYLNYKKHYYEVLRLKEERDEQELFQNTSINNQNNFFRRQLALYALIDLKSSLARGEINYLIRQYNRMPDYPQKENQLTFYKELLSKIPAGKESDEVDIKRFPNEGILLETYWKAIKREVLTLSIIYTIFFLPFSIFFWLSFINQRKNYLEIKSLRKEGNEKLLIEKAKSPKSSFFRNEIGLMAIYALADIRSNELAESITIYLKDLDFYGGKDLMFFRGRCLNLLNYVENEKTVDKEESSVKDDGLIETKRIYFISEKQFKDEKDMITGLPLVGVEGAIVACQFCGGLAKKEPLAKWLKEKKKCPVCRKPLSLSDCPEIMIKK